MLVLCRRTGESIILRTSDGPIEVMLCSVSRGDRGRLGITAPKSVKIQRDEHIDRDELQEIRHGRKNGDAQPR